MIAMISALFALGQEAQDFSIHDLQAYFAKLTDNTQRHLTHLAYTSQLLDSHKEEQVWGLHLASTHQSLGSSPPLHMLLEHMKKFKIAAILEVQSKSSRKNKIWIHYDHNFSQWITSKKFTPNGLYVEFQGRSSFRSKKIRELFMKGDGLEIVTRFPMVHTTLKGKSPPYHLNPDFYHLKNRTDLSSCEYYQLRERIAMAIENRKDCVELLQKALEMIDHSDSYPNLFFVIHSLIAIQNFYFKQEHLTTTKAFPLPTLKTTDIEAIKPPDAPGETQADFYLLQQAILFWRLGESDSLQRAKELVRLFYENDEVPQSWRTLACQLAAELFPEERGAFLRNLTLLYDLQAPFFIPTK
ncbi:MAG: hypothetical protein KDK65_00025 [Chlamydiia bacterium]|nr:hypothetical protein [Chlamydiia bacterium]